MDIKFVINVCCCYFILLCVLTCFLNKDRSHQSSAAFFTPRSYLLWRRSFCPYIKFFKNTWIFGGFLSVPHLVDKYAKIVDEQGRNFMCDHTLPTFRAHNWSSLYLMSHFKPFSTVLKIKFLKVKRTYLQRTWQMWLSSNHNKTSRLPTRKEARDDYGRSQRLLVIGFSIYIFMSQF